MAGRKIIKALMITLLFIISIVFTGCFDPDPIVPRKTWTFMVYISDCDLETFGIYDVNEMEYVGSGGNVNIIVQFDRWYSNSYADDISNGDWDSYNGSMTLLT